MYCMPPSTMQAVELQYYEALGTMYERMGRYGAAARCALAAVRQVGAVQGKRGQAGLACVAWLWPWHLCWCWCWCWC